MNKKSLLYRYEQLKWYPKRSLIEFKHYLRIVGVFKLRSTKKPKEPRIQIRWEGIETDLHRDSNHKSFARVLVVVVPTVWHSKGPVENDLHINLVKSLEENQYLFWDVYKELEESQPDISFGQYDSRHLEHIISDRKITHLFLDLNSPQKNPIFNIDQLVLMKKKYNLKIIFFAPDFFLQKYLHWEAIADQFVMSRPSKLNLLPSAIQSKVVLHPGIPYSQNLLITSIKDIDFGFVGSPTRGRKSFLLGIPELPIKTYIEFSGKSKGILRNYRDYSSILSRSKMTFSNGYINSADSLISGRFIESILAKTLVFYEDCPDLEYFFKANEHFISVFNRRELRMSVLKFYQDEGLRNHLTENAYNHYMSKYGSQLLYQRILED